MGCFLGRLTGVREMGEQNLSILDCRSAMVRALHVLRHTPQERMAQLFAAIYGYEMENACVKLHASVYEKMFEILLNDFDERYMPQLIQRQAELDSETEEPASRCDSQRTQTSHP